MRESLKMGSLTHPKKAWEEVVAAKRQAQLDSLRGFAYDEWPLKDIDIHAFINASDIVSCLLAKDTTCEDLVRSYIQKSVILKTCLP